MSKAMTDYQKFLQAIDLAQKAQVHYLDNRDNPFWDGKTNRCNKRHFLWALQHWNIDALLAECKQLEGV